MSSNLTNELNELIEKFTRFRQDLYDCFDARQDTVMDLLGGTVSQSFVSPRLQCAL